MNKAFVKEDSLTDEVVPDISEMDAALDSELFAAPGLGGPKNYITRRGFERLQAELQTRMLNERPALAAIVSGPQSRDPNDSKFAEVRAKLQELDRRIRFLQRRIDMAEVVDPEAQKGDRVLFGATVTVVDENDEVRTYRIVGVDETDLKSGKVSWVSPIGRALLQAQVGDSVVLETPQGEEELEIQKIEFNPID